MTVRVELDRLNVAVKRLWGPLAYYGMQMTPATKKPWHAGPHAHPEAVTAPTYAALLAIIEDRLATAEGRGP